MVVYSAEQSVADWVDWWDLTTAGMWADATAGEWAVTRAVALVVHLAASMAAPMAVVRVEQSAAD